MQKGLQSILLVVSRCVTALANRQEISLLLTKPAKERRTSFDFEPKDEALCIGKSPSFVVDTFFFIKENVQ